VLTKCGLRALGLKRAYGYDDVSWFEITKNDWQAQASNQ
jgi:RimJ/RimL family protein N-acetyltransferase